MRDAIVPDMTADNKEIRAIALFSGGLDSILAVKVLQEQGVQVDGLTFTTPFFSAKDARAMAQKIVLPLKVLDITEEHLKMIKKPRYGYGKYMNPCIDCHAMMIRKACEIAMDEGYDVVATGEVMGERPMSQTKSSMNAVVKFCGCPEIVLRPLSAKLMKPTKPEMEGLIDRDRLLDIQGRKRQRQIELAAKYGIEDYVQPAGGCLLTDPAFSRRLRELLDFNSEATSKEATMLKFGRHFRLPSGAKVIVGRDEKDNQNIMDNADSNNILLISDITPGPTVCLDVKKSDEDLELAASLCAAYASGKDSQIDIKVLENDRESRILSKRHDRSEFSKMKIE